MSANHNCHEVIQHSTSEYMNEKQWPKKFMPSIQIIERVEDLKLLPENEKQRSERLLPSLQITKRNEKQRPKKFIPSIQIIERVEEGLKLLSENEKQRSKIFIRPIKEVEKDLKLSPKDRPKFHGHSDNYDYFERSYKRLKIFDFPKAEKEEIPRLTVTSKIGRTNKRSEYMSARLVSDTRYSSRRKLKRYIVDEFPEVITIDDEADELRQQKCMKKEAPAESIKQQILPKEMEFLQPCMSNQTPGGNPRDESESTSVKNLMENSRKEITVDITNQVNLKEQKKLKRITIRSEIPTSGAADTKFSLKLKLKPEFWEKFSEEFMLSDDEAEKLRHQKVMKGGAPAESIKQQKLPKEMEFLQPCMSNQTPGGNPRDESESTSVKNLMENSRKEITVSGVTSTMTSSHIKLIAQKKLTRIIVESEIPASGAADTKASLKLKLKPQFWKKFSEEILQRANSRKVLG